MDLRFIERWLLEDPMVSVPCPHCPKGQIVFGVGLTLRYDFDTEDLTDTVKAEPFVYTKVNGFHNPNLTPEERKWVTNQAIDKANEMYARNFEVPV